MQSQTFYSSAELDINSNKRNVNMSEVTQRESLVNVSPNPANGYFYVSFDIPETNQKNLRVLIRDISGKIVEGRSLDNSTGVSYFESSSYASGTYVVSIEIKGVVLESNKLIIQ